MKKLKGFQRRYLKGLAHRMKPVVFIGQKGMTDSIIHSVDAALQSHELIKVKFVDLKEKSQKQEIGSLLEEKTGSEMVGMIGHTGIFYREQEDPEKKKIVVPDRSG
ncbi:MAG: YhbY family RNA-binding protein [Desulfobacteraceae bacterium]